MTAGPGWTLKQAQEVGKRRSAQRESWMSGLAERSPLAFSLLHASASRVTCVSAKRYGAAADDAGDGIGPAQLHASGQPVPILLAPRSHAPPIAQASSSPPYLVRLSTQPTPTSHHCHSKSISPLPISQASARINLLSPAVASASRLPPSSCRSPLPYTCTSASYLAPSSSTRIAIHHHHVRAGNPEGRRRYAAQSHPPGSAHCARFPIRVASRLHASPGPSVPVVR